MREKELRLALVCYGGISLAVYMHGITKEIWHLARASRAFHAGEPSADGSEAVYRQLLEEIEQSGGTRVRVLADIIAGASAGGINGIFLAQAIATGQSLEPLTDLWLASADVEALIDPQSAPRSRFSKVWALPLAWMAAGRSRGEIESMADEATRDEVRTKLSHFVRSRWFDPPFGGAIFTNLLLDALAVMAKGKRGPRLLPPGQPLDLFVTVTDFIGHPERIQLNSPPEVIETEHRVVVGFTDGGHDRDELAPVAELAFTARATSSFPGAFPAFRPAELDAVLEERGIDWPGRPAFLARILPRQAAAGTLDKVVLIDGSVLANAPFRPAIEALKERPARREVDRRFVYIDPVPGFRFNLGGGGGGNGGGGAEAPGFFQTIIGAATELPRQQPIRDNLEVIADRSARIVRMRDIVAAIRPEVEGEIETLFGRTFFLDRPTPARLAAWRKRAQTAAVQRAGYAYAAYARVKIAGVVETVAMLLHNAGGKAGLERWRQVRPVIDAAMTARGIGDGDANDATTVFLRTFDLGFRIRRLRLLARRLVDLEAAEMDLPVVREAIYGSLSLYLDRQRTDAHAAIGPAIRAIGDDASAVIDSLGESLDLVALDARTDAVLAHAFAPLDRDTRRILLFAYLGYAYYDTATLPLLQGEGLDEFDPIKVDRIAPDDAPAIRAGGAEATLKGIQFSNFGAFFSRAYRENDYLWGRLHGVERMIDITVSTLPAQSRLDPERIASLKRQAFVAILDEEEPRLTAIPALFVSLRSEIG